MYFRQTSVSLIRRVLFWRGCIDYVGRNVDRRCFQAAAIRNLTIAPVS